MQLLSEEEAQMRPSTAMLQLRSPRIIMQRVAEREAASQSREISGQYDPGETEKPRRGSLWQ